MTAVIHRPASSLKPHPDNPRTDLGDLASLQKSIKEVGILTPVLIVAHGEDNVILAGHRRVAAAKAIDPEHLIPTMVVEALDEVEEQSILLIENLQRENLTVSEQAWSYARLIGMGTKMKDLAARTGKSQTHIRSRLKIMELPMEVRELVDRDYLTLADCDDLLALKAPGEVLIDWAIHEDHPRVSQVREIMHRIELENTHQQTYDKLIAAGENVYTDIGDLPDGAKAIPASGSRWDIPDGLKKITLDPDKHRTEPCRAHLLEPAKAYGGVKRIDICVDPKRHAKRGESAVKPPENSSGKSAFEKAETAWQKERNTRFLTALQTSLADKDPLGELMVLGPIERAGADAAKAALLLLDVPRTEWEQSQHSDHPDPRRTLVKYAAKDRTALRQASVALEMGYRSQWSDPTMDNDLLKVARTNGYRSPKAPKREDFDAGAE